MTALSDALAESREHDRRRAARALLRRPLLRADGPDADVFRLVRRYAEELRRWFDRNTGWRLLVDTDVARLLKVPERLGGAHSSGAAGEETHPARDVRTRQPFGRRRYVLACLALSALERGDAQTTLGRLADQVVLGAADADLAATGIRFTLTGRDERADMVAVVRLLLDLGVLHRVAGDEEAFVRDAGDVLYDVRRRVLAVLPAGRIGPSQVSATEHGARLAGLTARPPATTDDQRNQRIRHRITAALLDEPVLYFADLDEAESTYLTGQRAAITNRITELTGLVPEIRAEGIAMVDPLDDLTDVRMPETGTEGHATLLVAEFLAARVGEPVPVDEITAFLRTQADAHRTYWRNAMAEPGAEVELASGVLERLVALRLIRRSADEITAQPGIHRYAVAEPTITEPA